MPNFDDCNNYDASCPNEAEGTRCDPSCLEGLDNLKRDRFELISAYLDGEVTADERRQVEAWLMTDSRTQRLYNRLLRLRQGVQSLPVPVTEQQPAEQLAAQVITRLERRPRRALLWGGMAIAALFVSAIVGSLPRSEFAPAISQSPGSGQNSPSLGSDGGLMIALDRPVIEIPKSATASEFEGELLPSN